MCTEEPVELCTMPHTLAACESQGVPRLQCMLSVDLTVKHTLFHTGAGRRNLDSVAPTSCRCCQATLAPCVSDLHLNEWEQNVPSAKAPAAAEDAEEVNESTVKLDRHTAHLTCI